VLTDHDARYLHGIRADDDHWPDAWNFSLQGTRSSIGLVNAAEKHSTPYDVDLAVLAGPPQDWPPMFLSGFMVTLRLGAIVRAGGRIGRGMPPYTTKWATPESEAQVLRAADRELALEAGRRTQALSAPSRLCCLWLTEATTKGRAWVQQMLGPRSFIMQVRLTTALTSCRCDAHWLDRVHADPDDADAVAGYWSGEPQDDDPLWEYLLEGQIAAGNPNELKRLREFILINGPPTDMLGPPPASERAST
jgi:hypothetical protein